MTWQYNGCAPWTQIIAWCSLNIPGRFWIASGETIAFDDGAAYTWFLLRWQ
jgi:hypothetical protein